MARKKDPTRTVTFRVAVRRYELLAEVARLRGVDLTAVLNQELHAREPALQAEVAERRRAAPAGAGLAEALAALAAVLPPADLAAVRHAAESLRELPVDWGDPATMAALEKILKAAHPRAKLPPGKAVAAALAALGRASP